jgi:hypothetical protein
MPSTIEAVFAMAKQIVAVTASGDLQMAWVKMVAVAESLKQNLHSKVEEV